MQTQNLHNQNAQAAADLAKKKGSTENPYDRLMNQSGNDSVRAKFSNVLSSLKTRFSGGVQSQTQDKNSSMINDISKSQKTAMEDHAKDLQKRLDDEEEDRKERDRKLAADHDRMVALNAEAADIASMTRMDIAAAAQQQQAQTNSEKLEEKADETKTMRPSDILASAFARKSTDGSTSSTSSAVEQSMGAKGANGATGANGSSAANGVLGSANGANGSGAGASLAANAAVGGLASGVAFTGEHGEAGAGSYAGQGASSQAGAGGFGSQQGQGSLGSSNVSGAAGYGTEEMTESAKAAKEMMQIEGVESDAEIRADLQERNRRQAAEINNAQIEESEADAKAQQLAKLNNQELRQNLDVLARETNVSKLSLQMANPQTMAQERRDAQALNGLPTSRDSTGSLTASAQSSNNLLNSLNGVAATENDDAAAAGLTLSGTGSASAAAKADAKSTAQQTALNQNRVNAVGQESDSKTLIKTANQTRLNHGSEAEGSRAALSSKGVRASADAQQSQNAANAAGTAKNSQTVNQRTQSSLTELARHSSSDPAKVLNGGEEVLQHAKDMTSANGANKTNNAQEALLRLATAQQNDKGATAKVLAEAQARSNLVADEALKNDGSRSESVTQALTSLKTGFKGAAAQTTNYSQSSLFASMFGDGEGVAALSDEDSTSSEFGSDDNSDKGAAFAGMASSQQAQGSNNASANVPAHMSQFAFSGSEDTDAAELHERVMQMAARNMKQLTMELSPNEMGKMKISIELSDTNDAVSVSLAAVNPETRAILEKALPKLKEILAQQNIKTEASVSDIDESELDNTAAITAARPSAASVTKAASTQRNHVSVATHEQSVDALIANARSLSEDDKAELQGISSELPEMDVNAASRALSSFAKHGTVVAR